MIASFVRIHHSHLFLFSVKLNLKNKIKIKGVSEEEKRMRKEERRMERELEEWEIGSLLDQGGKTKRIRIEDDSFVILYL